MRWRGSVDWAPIKRRLRARLAATRHADRHADRSSDEARYAADLPDEWDLELVIAALHLGAIVRPFVLIGRVIQYTLGLIAIVVFVLAAGMWVEHWRAPVSFRSIVVLTRHVRPGGTIEIAFDLDRRRICQVDPDWAVFGGRDDKFVFGSRRLDAGGPVGHDPFVRAFELPPDITPGAARFRATWSWVCPTNWIDLAFPRTYVSPDVPFTIDR